MCKTLSCFDKWNRITTIMDDHGGLINRLIIPVTNNNKIDRTVSLQPN